MSAIKILAAVSQRIRKKLLLVAAAVAVNFIAILFYDPPLGDDRRIRVVRLLLSLRP